MAEIRTEAICRIAITLPGVPERRGTGFLAGKDGLVLTARHVVWNEETKKPYRGTLSLTWDTLSAVPQRSDAEILYVDPTLDFAVLKAKSPPAVEPLPLGRGDRAVPDPTYWASFGYSESAKATGAVYSGTLFRAGGRLELAAIQSLGGGAPSVEGLSGGPCIVYGEVVGLIVKEMGDSKTGNLVEGRIYALPMEVIDDALRAAAKADPQLQIPSLPLEPAVEVPYRGAFSNELKKNDAAKLCEMGRALDLKLDGLDAGPQIDRILKALFALAQDGAIGMVTAHHEELHAQEKKWPSLAETFWVSPAAVAKIHQRITSGGLAVKLVAKDHEIARHHIRRVMYLRNGSTEGHLINTVEVPPGGADVVLAVKEALRAQFKCDGEKLKKCIGQRKTVCVVIEGPIESVDALKPLTVELPGLFFVIVQADAGKGDPHVEMVTPTPDIDAQERLLKDHDEARDALEKTLETLHGSAG